jgi:hypothetical protein
MKRSTARSLFVLAAIALTAPPLLAGGAWVPEPGQWSLNLGYSKKHAASSWDAFGERFNNSSHHDFRYTYLDGDIGLFPKLSGQFLLTFLDGREGPTGNLERNTGFSDAWFGLKYEIHGVNSRWPSARPCGHRCSTTGRGPTTVTSTTRRAIFAD